MAVRFRIIALSVVAAVLVACGSSAHKKDALFSFLPPDSTGITFVNEIINQPERNILTYDYLYNGGGVAVGDVNGDGRPDVYFTANMGANELYLNEGGFQFKNISKKAGVRDVQGWTTGVAMVDINGDDLLDLYICKSGPVGTEPRRNKLYVNQGTNDRGIPRFEEMGAVYGVDSRAYSTHATFFDYDRDGDLDLYLLNNPPVRDARLSAQSSRQWKVANDKLFRNDTNASGEVRFVDVTKTSGLKHEALGYGLSATVSDINQDGWPDVYVANDFEAEDRLYINQGDGTFRDVIHEWVDHMSLSSMGADIADFNNDARPDIFVADMFPADNRRQKLLNVGRRITPQKNYQYVRNMLQLQHGNDTFSEIGQLAGVSNTDWSWAALFADFNLDGRKDLYVTNGIRYDYTNLDFQYSDYLPTLRTEGKSPKLYQLVEEMPSTPVSNFAFQNEGDLSFEDKSAEWGVDQKGFSNGAAYADLDTDGDLDLIVNNVDEPAWIYRNTAVERTGRHYLRVDLDGTGQNRLGIGTTVTLTTPGGRTIFQEMIPARGFQSSVESVLTFGLSVAEKVDLTVRWPDQTRQHIPGVRANQTIVLHQERAEPFEPEQKRRPEPHLVSASPDRRGLTFEHRENRYKDYWDEPLLPHMLARLGPALAQGDANGDGREDVFIGGARGQTSVLLVQQPDGSFASAPVPAFVSDQNYEDVAATFVDVDGDGDQDLYVVSGGTSKVRAEAYQDRLYLNDGRGSFGAASDRLPSIKSSGGTVAAHDYDDDGDADLFIGGRVRPGAYPLSPRSYLLENTGGRFKDVTANASEALLRPGMVTDALWRDVYGDDIRELILAGEWMPIRVFRHNTQGAFTEITDKIGLGQSNGWWNRLAIADFDDDGDLDIVGGNRGLNAQVNASPNTPASVYVGDFDRDGDIEPIMSHYIDGVEYPVPRRSRIVDELSLFRARFPTYASYAEVTMGEMLTKAQWEKAERFRAYTFATCLFENQEERTFVRHELPVRAQFSPTRGIVVRDVNGDERLDVLLAGNDFTVRRPWGPSDAGKGVVLLNQSQLTFKAQGPSESGFFAPGDVRGLMLVPTKNGSLVVVGNNDAPIEVFRIKDISSKITDNISYN